MSLLNLWMLFPSSSSPALAAASPSPDTALDGSIRGEIDALDRAVDRLRSLGYDADAGTSRGELGLSAAASELRLARQLSARHDWYGAEAAVSDGWSDLAPSLRNLAVFGSVDELQPVVDGLDLVVSHRTSLLGERVRTRGSWDHDRLDQSLDEHWTALNRDAHGQVARALAWEEAALSSLDDVTLDLLQEQA